jgi:hypothetical protein
MTRGLTLNNPMNLEENSIDWIGQKKPTADPLNFLAQFDSMQHGLHAGMENLVNKQVRHGLKTWNEIIPKYAPAPTNNAGAYVVAICEMTHVGPDDVLNLTDPGFVALASRAIIFHEQGSCPIDEDMLDNTAQAVVSQIIKA